jgi:integrase
LIARAGRAELPHDAGPSDRPACVARDHLPRLARLKLPDAHIYDLRHLNITYQYAGGTDPRTIADRAGHRDQHYLAKRYAHTVAAAQERAVNVSSALLARAGLVSRG